ncbi:MAG TPA: molybdopterin-dependent oxidoreductase [Burkholderiaceae bacterium]|jgi:DMSO/TMAO reductase YedYZ molybdopterin-dependent catalytic subunit|nr:molybdopterin-dependent oxidoreductase [Burkholderiaceae bacterium]
MTPHNALRPATGLTPRDRQDLVKDAARLLAVPARRRFLTGGVTLGGLAMLTGCNVTDSTSAESLLMAVSRFNDKVQAWLFDPDRLAPTYPESMITRPFPFNAYYEIDRVPSVDAAGFRLRVGGRVRQPGSWTLEQLASLPQQEQITRHICVEGWSAIGRWGGVRFSHFLDRIGADLNSKYVGFKCADDYYESIDMPTALHPQTVLALTYDGQTLPPKYGFPMKLRMPTKLGYKNPKHIVEMFVTNDYPGGYWEDQGYNWFGGS